MALPHVNRPILAVSNGENKKNSREELFCLSSCALFLDDSAHFPTSSCATGTGTAYRPSNRIEPACNLARVVFAS